MVVDFDKVVFVLGSPSFTFESAASSVVRVLEAFKVDSVEIYYSSFAEEEARLVQRFARMLFGVEPHILTLPASLSDAVSTLRQALSGDSLAVPTPGSILGAVALTRAADEKGSRLAHVMFPFGVWTGFFYPYVPRYLQPIFLLGSQPLITVRARSFNAQAAKNFLDDQENRYITTRLRKGIAQVSLKLNEALPDAWVNNLSIPEIALELRDEVVGENIVSTLYLKTTNASVKVCKLKKLRRQPDVRALPAPSQSNTRAVISVSSPTRELVTDFVAKAFYALAGGKEKCLRKPEAEKGFKAGISEVYRLAGFELLNLDSKGTYVLDTNAVFYGVHNLARQLGPRLVVPYCVRYEVLNKLARSKSPCMKYHTLLARMALEVLESYASRLLSDAIDCDMAIPSIDPELVKGDAIISADRNAVEIWRSMALSRYASVRLVSEEDFKPAEGPAIHFAMLQLASFLYLLRKHLKQ